MRLIPGFLDLSYEERLRNTQIKRGFDRSIQDYERYIG